MLMYKELDVEKIKNDFAIFKNHQDKKFSYLDNAATSQTPHVVVQELTHYYENYCANVHRGVYKISEQATFEFENARKKVADFIHAKKDEIIFTKSATEALNIVAFSYGKKNVFQNDNVVITELEHHSNFVPWQELCKQVGAQLRIVPVNDSGEIDLESFSHFIDDHTKIVSLSHMSNVTGTIHDVKKVAQLVHRKGGVLVVDGAQSVAHVPIDVNDLECDFFAFSGHKMCGPTGVGVLFGKKELLGKMDPFTFGGGMISSVGVNDTTYGEVPTKFEGGTPNIAGVIAFSKAIDYLDAIGMDAIHAHDVMLTTYAREKLNQFDDVFIFGTQNNGVLSFTIKDIHPHDVATILDSVGVMVRAGHHCCEPLMKKLEVAATTRASFYLYNSKEDVDLLCEGIKKVLEVFNK